MFGSSVKCEKCGKHIALRSFSLEPRFCPHCGHDRRPDDLTPRERRGCLLLLPVAVATMFLLGFAGTLIGRVLSGLFNDPDLATRLGILGAVNGFGIVSLLYVRLYQSKEHHERLALPAAFTTFFVVGLKFGHGHGVAWMFVVGIANGLVGCLSATGVVGLVHTLREPGQDVDDDEAPE